MRNEKRGLGFRLIFWYAKYNFLPSDSAICNITARRSLPLPPTNSVVPAAQPDAPPKITSKQAADIVADVEAECSCKDAIEDATADVT